MDAARAAGRAGGTWRFDATSPWYWPKGRVAMAITVDDMPRVDYSPDNAGNILISNLANMLIVGLGAMD
jgi:hypothetical protein